MKSEENIHSSEKKMNTDLLSLGIKKVANSTCIITTNDNCNKTGFFVTLPINMGDRYLYGLLTTNQNISEEQLKPGSVLRISFYESKGIINYIIPETLFVFTCPFLDVSFIEIPLGTFKDIEYLRIWDEPLEGQKIYYIKHSIENNLLYTEGNIIEFYGTDIIYKIKENNIENPLSGSAIISLSKLSLGDVVGINKGLVSTQNNEVKYATHIDIIIQSIKSLIYNNIKKPLKTLSSAKDLSDAEIDILSQIGLKRTENPYIFISPGSFLITPLWFYRTQYSWFWTPKEPKDFSKEEIKKCNWSLIKANRPIIAIGGMYDNIPPAQRNIMLIKNLINSGLKFLI